MRMLWTLLVTLLMVSAFSCSEDTERTITPAGRGARGETCQARNDCASGLACINATCSRNDFDVEVNAMHCDIVECEDDADCCGDRPRDPPPECAERISICFTPSVDGCVQTTCTEDSECGDGICQGDTCVDYQCSVSGYYCLDETDCTSTAMVCDCANPEYDPTSAICTDPACEELCTLRCEQERCVTDTTCAEDADCLGLASDICDDGRCVECTEDEDCNEDADEECMNGRCQRPCQENEECPLFHACVGGECVERGCDTDTECILAAAGSESFEDPRLAMCLPSDSDDDISVCKVPCENDAACSQFEACVAGFCVFIGCTTDEECRAFFNLQNEQVSDDKPYITRAVCRE